MISNENDIENYGNLNKIYIPENYRNENWKYNFNGDFIIIRSNQNCYTQYSTTYCTCYAYNFKTNVISEGYNCNTSSDNNQTININYISDDINDSTYIRERYIQDKSIYIGIFIIGIILAILMTKRGAYK